MKKIVSTGLAGLMTLTLVGELSMAAGRGGGVREVLRVEVVRDRILDRIGQKVAHEGISSDLQKNLLAKQMSKAADKVAADFNNKLQIRTPLDQLKKLLEGSLVDGSVLKKATQSDKGTTLIEMVELAMSLKESETQTKLKSESKMSDKEIQELDSAADAALKLVSRLAELDPAALTEGKISKNYALQAMLRQVSQTEALLTEFTSVERASWVKQMDTISNDSALRSTPEVAYENSIRKVVAAEKKIDESKVTDEQILEKYKEIIKCKA